MPQKDKARSSGRIAIPTPQTPLETAQHKAVEALHGQSDEQLQWLGAERLGTRWRLPVMDGVFLADTNTGEVRREDGQHVRPNWRILALHYLAVRARPESQPPAVTFASQPSARVYASVYEQRVNLRLCAGVGKDASTLRTAAAAIGARLVAGGDLAFEINVFPRLLIRLIWYAGDQELSPSCTLLLPANTESFLCTEDIVVLSESFVSRLSGRPF